MTQTLARILFWRAVRSAMPSPVVVVMPELLPPVVLPPKPARQPVVLAASLATATRLRALADALGLLIERKMQPAVANQNLTHRRAEMVRSMRQDGERLQELQQALRSLADLHETGNCPARVRKLTNKSAVEPVLCYSENYPSTGFAAKLGYTAETFQEAKQFLKSLTTAPSEEQQRSKQLQELEHKLIGCDIPGFFPTPGPVSKKMLELVADYLSDHRGDRIRVLEPSAGKGDLLDALRDEYPEECVSDWTVHCCEINFTLKNILREKGYYLVAGDFLDLSPDSADDQYDLILMNPPSMSGTATSACSSPAANWSRA